MVQVFHEWDDAVVPRVDNHETVMHKNTSWWSQIQMDVMHTVMGWAVGPRGKDNDARNASII